MMVFEKPEAGFSREVRLWVQVHTPQGMASILKFNKAGLDIIFQ